MELSRLSNSLGSVCSQRRGRLAAGVLRPQLPSLFELLFPSLSPSWSHLSSFFFCFCLIVHTSALLQLTREAVVCLLVPNSDLCPPTSARSPKGCQSKPCSDTQWRYVSGTLALCRSSSFFLSKPHNLRRESGCGTKPSEGAYCSTSCPERHTPRHL